MIQWTRSRLRNRDPLLSVLLAFVAGCGSTKSIREEEVKRSNELHGSSHHVEVSSNARNLPSDLCVIVERTEYLGGLHTSITVSRNGRVSYRGGPKAALTGEHQFDTLKPHTVREIWEAINGLRFFDFDSNYLQRGLADVGTSAITVQADGATKRVVNRWSQSSADEREDDDIRAHVVLEILADYIEERAGLKH